MQHRPEYIGSQSLFCIVSEPEQRQSNTALVILNSGLLPSYGPFRLANEIAKVANDLGLVVVRVDQSGKGESEPRSGMTRLQTLHQDYADVLEFLGSMKITETLLVGLCSGADDTLALIPNQPSIVGAILLDGYARKNLKFRALQIGGKLIRWQSWRTLLSMPFKKSTSIASPLHAMDVRDMGGEVDKMYGYRVLLERGGRILAVFTGSISSYYNHSGQLTSNLKGQVPLGNLLEHRFENSEHIYPSLDERSQLLCLIRDWLKAGC